MKWWTTSIVHHMNLIISQEKEAQQTSKKEVAMESWKEEAFIFWEVRESVCFDVGRKYNKKLLFKENKVYNR